MNQNKKIIIITVILFTIVVLLAIFIIFKNNFVQTKSNSNLNTENETINSQSNQVNLTGMIWTSGLMDSEQEVLNLNSEYQLTKSAVSDGWTEKTTGMYLLSDNSIDLANYLGKCVTVSGDIKPGWENLINNNYEINGKWTYNKSALVIKDLQERDIYLCLEEYDHTIKDEEELTDSEYINVTGTLGFAKRPAPDINYDFEIILDEPFIDEQSPTGDPFLTKRLDIYPGTSDIYMQVVNNIGKPVEVSGYMGWGYSESRILIVDTLKIK